MGQLNGVWVDSSKSTLVLDALNIHLYQIPVFERMTSQTETSIGHRRAFKQSKIEQVMKTIIITVLISLSSYMSQANDHTYLRIVVDTETDISYPPGSGFILQDTAENNILTYAELEKQGEYEITKPMTLFVFVSWKDEPDTYELSSGILYAMKQSNTTYWQTNYEDGEQRKYLYDRKAFTKGLEITRSRFFDYDGDEYDASIEFNNDVIFYYKDGKAEAWQHGKTLKIEGKYLISTQEGLIKLSYNPRNKEIWYVFEPKEN